MSAEVADVVVGTVPEVQVLSTSAAGAVGGTFSVSLAVDDSGFGSTPASVSASATETEMKAAITRKESDVASLKRELGKFGASR